MAELSAQLEAEHPSPHCVVLHVKGHLYMGTLPKVEQRFESFLPQCANKKVVLNLSETTYVSSDGWSLFLVNSRRIRSMGGTLFLAGMKGEVLNAFDLLELHRLVRHFPNVPSALRAESLKLPTAKAKIS